MIGRVYPEKCGEIIERIQFIQDDSSAAIRTKAKKALGIVKNEGVPIPAEWVKRV